MAALPRLYGSLARWFPLLTPHSDYEKEAVIYREHFLKHNPQTRTVLELGCGGGHNAFYLKAHFDLTLTDISAEMIALSRKLNPECEQIRGDMRTLRLNRAFDTVFIHDAIGYMATIEDLRQAVSTAALHCKPGGCLLILPDFFQETFLSSADHGGTDGERESIRYLEWVHDPDPADHTYLMDFALMLRDQEGRVTVEHDRHVMGLFNKREWLEIVREAGLEGRTLALPYPGNKPEELHAVYAWKA